MPKAGRPAEDDKKFQMDTADLIRVNKYLGSVGRFHKFVQVMSNKEISYKTVDNYHSLKPVVQETYDIIEYALTYLRSVDSILKRIESVSGAGVTELPNIDLIDLRETLQKFLLTGD